LGLHDERPFQDCGFFENEIFVREKVYKDCLQRKRKRVENGSDFLRPEKTGES